MMPTTAAEWVRTVPLDCSHSEARELYVCCECAAANLDAYARQRVEAFRERAEQALPKPPDDDSLDILAYYQECVAAIRALKP